MDRSLAGRSGLGRLLRPLSLIADPAILRGAGGGSAAPGGVHRPLGPLARPARAARSALNGLWAARSSRRALLAALVALALLGGGWMWLRHSSFVSVQNVQISGVQGPQAPAVEAALLAAAHRMSTLDVKPGALRASVAAFPFIGGLRISASFPHGLRIRVLERRAVAALVVAGTRTAVAADGVVLGPSLLSASLPTVTAPSEPAPGQTVAGPTLLASLTILGAAPAPLARHVKSVFTGPRGVTVAMANGLLVYFGDGSLPHAKWLSLARVLSDPSSAGASYVDVRLPSRPAAGFPAGVTPPSSSATGASAGSEQPSSSESTVGALAAGLSAGGAGGTSSAGTESGSPTSTGSATTTTAPAEGTSTTPAETPSTGSPETGGEGSQPSSEPSG